VFFSSYLQTYLQRDVRDLAQVGSMETFTRFARACAARTAQLLNLSDLARDLGVSVPTAKSWLSVLVASCQVFLLQPYHTSRASEAAAVFERMLWLNPSANQDERFNLHWIREGRAWPDTVE
jgi:hypothetical protein